MGSVGAEPWGRVPGPAVCGRRAGDSCPEWRLRSRSRSRGRGQWLSDGPRRRPQLLTGEGADLGLGDRGRVGVAKSGVLVSGGWDTEGPSALLREGGGDSGSARCSVSATPFQGTASVGAGGGSGQVGLGSAGEEAFLSRPRHPAPVTSPTTLPRPSPLLSPPLCSPRLLSRRGRLCPAPPRPFAGEETPRQ